MKNFLWQLLAFIVSRQPIVSLIIWHASRHPFKHLEGYMERFWVFNEFQKAKDGTKARKYMWAPSIRLHHILRADNERDLHDHPWNARTIILRGGYVETRLINGGKGSKWFTRTPGSTATLHFGEYHKIDTLLGNGEDVWTLFFMWDYQEDWGFLVDGKKISHYEYLGKTNA